ncbi:AAA family ATPase [Treponema sp.]|uniref:AAA family ATPase n=1 Tax=Treponema sp. TaxID=166 RepID=UPI0026003C74|nr:AAA family ATPase [Treponema sp.]MBR4320981.1 AAA family ATPase [Treponema sp.]
MGIYLNPDNDAFRNFVATNEYVDKTLLIEKLNLLLNNPARDFVCVSRPRRFGKSLAENMISAYYSKGADSKELFAPFKISKKKTFATYLNKFNVIKIDLYAMFSDWQAHFSEEASTKNSFSESFEASEKKKQEPFILSISRLICSEFREQFSDIEFPKSGSLASFIQQVYAQKKETFIIIIDEYDVMVRAQVSDEEFELYLAFLNSLFKNETLRPAISLAYITGILPVVREKIQSKLNTFHEYTMLDAENLDEFVGFTTPEVKKLCKKYKCSFDDCKSWYDGYHLGEYEIYNPQAVFNAVTSGKFKSYWSATSSYEVVAEKLRMNFDGTKDAVIKMLGGGRVLVEVGKYRNYMTTFYSKDDVFTYLIHLGYLAYDEEEQECYIPNREIYLEWQKAISDEADYAETNKIINASRELLEETFAGNEKAVAEALDKSHIHVTSNMSYNNEKSLQSAIYLAYIYAINHYLITKEMPAGKGYADIVYVPLRKDKPAMIIELKRNSCPETALNQIRQKQYFDSLENWQGEILFVGINYDEETKLHECKIERFVK